MLLSDSGLRRRPGEEGLGFWAAPQTCPAPLPVPLPQALAPDGPTTTSRHRARWAGEAAPRGGLRVPAQVP